MHPRNHAFWYRRHKCPMGSTETPRACLKTFLKRVFWTIPKAVLNCFREFGNSNLKNSYFSDLFFMKVLYSPLFNCCLENSIKNNCFKIILRNNLFSKQILEKNFYLLKICQMCFLSKTKVFLEDRFQK